MANFCACLITDIALNTSLCYVCKYNYSGKAQESDVPKKH